MKIQTCARMWDNSIRFAVLGETVAPAASPEPDPPPGDRPGPRLTDASPGVEGRAASDRPPEVGVGVGGGGLVRPATGP